MSPGHAHRSYLKHSQGGDLMKRIIYVVLVFILISESDIVAQYCPTAERGDHTKRRRSDIAANSLRTSVLNSGFTGRTGAGQGTPYEWPAYTNRQYVAVSAMFVGGEVINAVGDTSRIILTPAFRSNPANGADWNMEPVPQYLHPGSSQLARSDDPTTWPPVWVDKMHDSTDPGWAGSWNGLLGKNVIIDGTEFYTHYTDDNYDRHPFFPDSSDLTRRGLGIVVSERTLQFRDPLLDDAMIIVTELVNVGRRTINRAAVTQWIADFVGGDGDSQDDEPRYDLPRQLIHFNDRDGISSNPAFHGVRVGTPTYLYIHTPENLGITNVQYLPAGTINFSQTADSFYWNKFMKPGSYFDPNSIVTGEYDLFTSVGFFSLEPCVPKRLTTAWVFGNDSLEGRRKANYVRSFVGGGYSINGVNVAVFSPAPGEIVSGQVQVQWNANVTRPSLKADILFSSNFGDTWKAAATEQPNTGTYIWHVDSLDDGIFYQLRVIVYDSLGIGYSTMDSTFTINNPAPANPQIRLERSIGGGTYQGDLTIRWLAGSADGGSVTVDLAYRIPGENTWVPIATGLANTGLYTWNTLVHPNAEGYRILAEVRDGISVGNDTTGGFRVRNTRYILHDTAFVQHDAVGTGLIEPHIVDPNSITGHTYRVSFTTTGGTTRYNVIDENTSTTVVSNATQVYGNVEGPLFDGIRLLVRNDQLAFDSSKTGWNHPGLYGIRFFLEPVPEGSEVDTADYIISIGAVGIDTSRAFSVGGSQLPSRIVNFTVLNAVTGLRMPFAFIELDGNDGRWTTHPSDPGIRDIVLLLKRKQPDSLILSWLFFMTPEPGRTNPQPGDSLWIHLFKPFLNGDYFRFTAVTGGLLNAPAAAAPLAFELGQNFPNPFNPETNIRFSLGRTGEVHLEIFDILGRKVRTLVREVLRSGEYVVRWSGVSDAGTRVATGVYLYRLTTAGSSNTKKLLLMK